eukprot:CAMPEP_0202868696 /NCGR_PEP_ID=MMETSP1391-20130828/11018_1 /ASSEMBLY_ACC=CAM_ASM_000867 /TAXON_ID=1034604 /ORGANISM="Chlamydomonas leiostraca, Strain SAG 11-49" /LENGTH=579 /DNA_ID=CAMNT_0049548895 /DNA_START=94 /DNA_END=1833 /DNA_ORIENTATION=+
MALRATAPHAGAVSHHTTSPKHVMPAPARPGRKACRGLSAGLHTLETRVGVVAEASVPDSLSPVMSSMDLNILGSDWEEGLNGTQVPRAQSKAGHRTYAPAHLPLREVNHGAAAVRGGPKSEMQDRHTALTNFGTQALAALSGGSSGSSLDSTPALSRAGSMGAGHSLPACDGSISDSHSWLTAAVADAACAADASPFARTSAHVVAAARVMPMPIMPIFGEQSASGVLSEFGDGYLPAGSTSSPSGANSYDGYGSGSEGPANLSIMDRLSPQLQGLVAALPSSFAGVFDGHSGSRTSTRAAARLQELVAANLDLWATIAPAALSTAVNRAELDAVRAAFGAAFEQLDAECLETARVGGPELIDGSTALAGLQVGLKLYVANAGDCRAVLGRGGAAMSLSSDHKPNLAMERARIEAVGGIVHQVRGVWRIVRPLGPGLGAKVCAVSRGLGDLDFKEPAPLISPQPDVTATALQPGVDSCVVYGSDGLWGVINDQEAIDVVEAVCAEVRATNAHEVPTQVLANAAARALVRLAQDRGSCDDITAVVTLFDWAPADEDNSGDESHSRHTDSYGGRIGAAYA